VVGPVRDYGEAYEHARPAPPFSNGTEGYGWMAAHCATCIHDRPARQGREEDGCPLVTVALVGRTPAEWIPGDPITPTGYSIREQYHCVEYRHEDDPDPTPRPIPTPPGQLELVPRERYTAVRMFVQPGAAPRPVETVTVLGGVL
jgi:hypothetical protein